MCSCGTLYAQQGYYDVIRGVDDGTLADGERFISWEKEVRYAKTYHVACNHPDASDSNPGTEEEPFLTISKAASVLRPGERVVIHGGLYRKVKMDTHFKRRGTIYLDGVPLEQVMKPVEMMGHEEGAFWIEHNGLRIHVRFPEETGPGETLVEAAIREQLFVPRSYGLGYIRIRGITSRHAAKGFPLPQRGAFSANRGNHWITEDNLFHRTRSQYWISGDYGAGGNALYTDGSDIIDSEYDLTLDIENTGPFKQIRDYSGVLLDLRKTGR